MKITALVPCRAGSTRVKEKNIRPFADSSLLEIKLQQLLLVDSIDRIILSTDDESVISIWEENFQDRVQLHRRPKHFASNECDTNTLVQHFIESLDYEHLLWTHTTSPFLDSRAYAEIVMQYTQALQEGFDSLLTATHCHEFALNEDGSSLNYDEKLLGRWPRTQDVTPFYIVDSGAFLCSKEVMKKYSDRIGKKPFFYTSNPIQGIDIDWPKDFVFAEQLWTSLFQPSKPLLSVPSNS